MSSFSPLPPFPHGASPEIQQNWFNLLANVTGIGEVTIRESVVETTYISIEHGLIQSSPTVGDGSANSQGIRIDNTGVYGFSTNTTTPSIVIRASDGNIVVGQTGFDTGPPGFFIGRDAGSYKVSIGDPSGNKMVWDGTDLSISGNISASTGTIGGWTIGAGALTAGNISLDATNTRIQAGPNANNYVRISPSGITGVDNVLGTTFSLPTNGDPPRFSSGIIEETIFEIRTQGVIRTSETVGDVTDGQGVIINDTGVKGFAGNGTLNFYLDATDGTITAQNATISGAITLQSGSSGLGNLTDAGDLATQDDVDWATQVTGTGKPANNADVTLSAINGSLSLTGGGLVLASGGASIRAGQTAWDTGEGFWLGHHASPSSYRFSIGDSSGDKMTYDPTDGLNIVGSITGSTITGGLFRTAPGTGERIVINESGGGENAIRWRASDGSLKIHIGTQGLSVAGYSDDILASIGTTTDQEKIPLSIRRSNSGPLIFLQDNVSPEYIGLAHVSPFVGHLCRLFPLGAGPEDGFIEDPYVTQETIGDATRTLAVGSVGSVAFLYNSTSETIDASSNITRAGSSLSYSNCFSTTSGNSPSGTWRLLGRNETGGSQSRTTLWLRVA